MNNVTIGIVSIISNGLLCLGYLAGVVVGILLIIRKVKLPGILTIVGFGLLGINLLYGVLFNTLILPQLITNLDLSYAVVLPVNTCLQAFIAFVAVAALIAGIFTGVMPKKDMEGI